MKIYCCDTECKNKPNDICACTALMNVTECPNRNIKNKNSFNQEREIFLEMKKFYPNLLQDTTFEKELEDAIKYIDGQLEGYYIDIRDGGCDELTFGILRIAFEEYKQKHNLI